MKPIRSIFVAFVAAMASATAVAQSPVDAQLNAVIPSCTVRYSLFASPESRRAYAVIARFFDRHLGH